MEGLVMEGKGLDYFGKLVGVQIIEVKEGYAKASLKITRDHSNALGVTHGGAIFTLADCAFAQAVNFGERTAVAIQVSINFLNPSYEGDILTAEAVRVLESKKIGLYNVKVTGRENKLIAIFSGTAYIKSLE